ncbi:TrmH family RNA methyltransferase [Sandaracinus amylolyticus]|uniref:TrmH family RNA methyltransferase n=1 Tax=Sandaracinus amylolyticus TaxID=927083 RepID=UPI001F4494D9|nr:RNA methyltransferase [Sandaracinus amylolyticus]UJR78646.1 23S rRNA (Guanosine-2'-O-)-methyltransferase rlmB [Sandaracinus amylolyticus]
MASRVPHEKVYGIAATRAVLTGRMGDVIRIAFSASLKRELAPALREAAARRIAFEERTDEDLAKIAGSVHHEGICLAARPRRVLDVDALIGWRDARAILALDDVANPHNVGAIVRSAAFFGAGALLVEGPTDRAPLTPAAVRVAQGGAEHLAMARTERLPDALRKLAARGFAVVGADVRGARPLRELRWPERVVLVMGSEGEGLRHAVLDACTDRVVIEGTGAVESLNVSVAAGVLLASWASTRSRDRGSSR